MNEQKVNFYIDKGSFFYKQGDLSQASLYYKKALEINPNQVVALNNLGMIYYSLKNTSKSFFYIKKLLKLSKKHPEPWRNLGLLYNITGQHKKAIFCFKKAIAIKNDYIITYLDLGITYNLIKDQKNALRVFEKITKLEPKSPWSFHNLAVFYLQKNNLIKAIEYFQKCLEIDPNFESAYSNLYLTYRKLCDWKNSQKLEKILDNIINEDPYVSLIRSEDPRKNYISAKQSSHKILQSIPKISFRHTWSKNNKIRLGYLSRDFKDHALGQVTHELFKHHDRNNFEVYLFSYGEDDNSKIRKEIKKGADKFFDIAGINDLDAARFINKNQIDILIDLTGHTLGTRIGIAAFRPCPIQVSWLGFAGTTGANFFDYILVDKIIALQKERAFFSEKLIFLPGCYQPNSQFQQIKEKGIKRSDFGLPEESFIFSSFNQPYKFDPIMFSVWMDIIKEIPNSILWLPDTGKETNQNLINFAKIKEIQPKRLFFSKRLPNKEDHLKRLSLTDLALDTYIFGGHTTTTDYLRAGVPVLTRRGTHLISRVSASILINFGLSEMVTDSLEEYKALAVKLATNKNLLDRVRNNIKSLQKNNPIFDVKSFAKKLEAKYQYMIKQ